MDATPPVIQAKIAAEPAKVPMVPLVIAVVLGVVIAVSAVGAIVYLLLRSGKLPVQSMAVPAVPAVAPVETHTIALEPMLVNLADTSGGAYLRVALTLQVTDLVEEIKENSSDTKGTDKEANAGLRDTVLAVLGRQASNTLLEPDGKIHLKQE